MFLLSPEADMRTGNLQAQVPRKNAFWFADRDARRRLTKGFLANGDRSILRLRRTSRTRIIAESQRNGGFSLADSQPKNVLGASRIWHTGGTQYGPNLDFRIARYPLGSVPVSRQRVRDSFASTAPLSGDSALSHPLQAGGIWRGSERHVTIWPA